MFGSRRGGGVGHVAVVGPISGPDHTINLEVPGLGWSTLPHLPKLPNLYSTRTIQRFWVPLGGLTWGPNHIDLQTINHVPDVVPAHVTVPCEDCPLTGGFWCFFRCGSTAMGAPPWGRDLFYLTAVPRSSGVAQKGHRPAELSSSAFGIASFNSLSPTQSPQRIEDLLSVGPLIASRFPNRPARVPIRGFVET